MADKHDAFISYSHSADAALAPALERGLERLAKPLLRLRAMDVFRDQTSLSAQPELWTGILEHLSRSRWLLVLASPGLAASHWCTREIEWWLENRARDTLLIALTDGQIAWDEQAGDFDWGSTTALAPALRGCFAGVPLYVDLRPMRGVPVLGLDHAGFRAAVLDLAATIRGIPKDHLDGEDVRQLRRTRWLVRAAIAVIVVLAALAVMQTFVALDQRDEARRQARIALSQRLASDARRQPDDRIDRALLLTVAAQAVQPTPEAEHGLLSALLRTRLQRIEPGAAPPSQPTPCKAAAADVATPDSFRDTVCRLRMADGSVAALSKPPAAITAARFPARLLVLDASNGTQSEASSPHYGMPVSLIADPDGRALASSDADGVVALWRRDGAQWTAEQLANPAGPLTALTFMGNTLVGTSAHGDHVHWSVRSAQALARTLDDQRVTGVGLMGFVRVAFLAGGGLAASNGIDGRVLGWDLTLEDPRGHELMQLEGPVRALAATRDGAWLAAASETDIAVLEVATGRTHKVAASCRRLSGAGLTISSDGQTVMVAGAASCLQLWRLGTAPIALDLPEERGRIYSITLGADGGTLLFGGTFGLVRWRLVGNTLLDPTRLLPRMLVTKAVREGGMVAAGTWAGEVWLVPDDGEPRQLGRHPSGAVLGLAFSPAADLLVSTGTLGAATVWDVRRGEPLLQNMQTSGVGGTTDLAFSADGTLMVAGNGNRVLSVWPMTFQAWRNKACEIAGRELSPTEWAAYLPDQQPRPLCR